MAKITRLWSEFVITRKWLVIALLTSLTLIALAGFGKLYFYNNFISWLSPDDPVISLFIKTTKKFSTNELAMILLKPGKGVFTRDFLGKVKSFTEKLSARKEVFLVGSLSSVSDIKKVGDGIEVRDLLEEIPQSAKELADFRDYVLSKEGYKNNVVSADGKWAAVSVFVADGYNSDKVVKNLVIPETEKTFAADAEIYYTGIPADAFFLNKFAVKDIILLTPLIFIIIAVILFLSFRSVKGVVLPSLVVLLSSIWLFGMMGHLRIPITFIATAIPVLLTALGSAYGIHVLNKFNHDLQGPAKLQLPQLQESISQIFVPVILTGLTTFVGFLSFKSARLTLVSDFGFYAAIGIAFALLISLSLVPALSSFTSFDKVGEIKNNRLAFFLGKMADLVIRRRFLVLIFSLLLAIGFALGIPKLKKEINFSEYYPVDSLPRRAHDISQENFKGAYPVVFYLESENVKSPEILRILRRAENYLLSIENLCEPASIVSLVQELNFQLNDRYAVPASAKAVSNLWFFVDGRKELKQLLTNDDRETIMFSKTSQSTTRLNKLIAGKLDTFTRENIKPGFTKFNLQDLSAAQKTELRNLEARYLSSEVLWLAQHYMKQNKLDPDAASSPPGDSVNNEQDRLPAGIKQALLRSVALAPLKPDPLVIYNYIYSKNFDFLVNEQRKKTIYDRLTTSMLRGNLTEPAIINVLAELVPKDEFDEEIAGDAAQAILFKLSEERENRQAELTWQELKQLFRGGSHEFEKRVKSIIYDLLDDLVVLPAHLAPDIKGETPALHFFNQSGFPALMERLDYSLSISQIQSLLLAYFITLILMVIMRRNFILGLISTIPIIFTIMVMYGFMGHAGINLDYTTMMVGGISIGVGIDYAIHLVHGIMSSIDRNLSLEDAIKTITIERGKAILANAAAVMAGFAVLLLSSMSILRNFGATMIGSMFLAALSALTILPAAILILNPKIKKRRQK